MANKAHMHQLLREFNFSRGRENWREAAMAAAEYWAQLSYEQKDSLAMESSLAAVWRAAYEYADQNLSAS